MSSRPIVRTYGKGIDQLLQYFLLFESEPPNKLPRNQSQWKDGAMYDAPHGFIGLASNGDWAADCCYSSVQFCKNQSNRDKEPDIAMKNSPEKLANIIRNHLNLPSMCVKVE